MDLIEVVVIGCDRARIQYWPTTPEAKTLTCPDNQSIPYRGDGKSQRFPTATCRACTKRDRCITPKNKYGRTLNTHAHETFLREMHADLAKPKGRQRRRERIPVEHALARIGHLQSRHARFRGLEKNQFDLVRTALVANLYVLGRAFEEAA